LQYGQARFELGTSVLTISLPNVRDFTVGTVVRSL